MSSRDAPRVVPSTFRVNVRDGWIHSTLRNEDGTAIWELHIDAGRLLEIARGFR